MSELLGYGLVIAFLVTGLFGVRACSNNDHQAGHGFTTICIEGKEFYSKNEAMSYRGFLANKLDSDGKPVKCGVNR